MSTPDPLPSPRDVIILEEFRSLNSAHARLRRAGVSQATTDLLLRLLAALAEESESGSKKS